MSRNPNEYSVRIIVELNDITDDKRSIDRQCVVEAGDVDINSIVEDMIAALQDSKRPF